MSQVMVPAVMRQLSPPPPSVSATAGKFGVGEGLIGTSVTAVGAGSS